MTGADKIVCQAATLLLLFTLTSTPAKAQFAGFGGEQRPGHDDADGADAGNDEGEDGQAPLRHDDADHGPDDEPHDGRRRRWRFSRHDRAAAWKYSTGGLGGGDVMGTLGGVAAAS